MSVGVSSASRSCVRLLTTSDGASLHLSLGVDNDTGGVLEVEEDTVPPAPGLALTDDNGGHDCEGELRGEQGVPCTMFEEVDARGGGRGKGGEQHPSPHPSRSSCEVVSSYVDDSHSRPNDPRRLS